MERRILRCCGAILILAGFLFGCGKTGQEPVSVSPWPMFHCDLQHTGRSPYVGPQTDVLEWRFRTNDAIGSSPAIAKDGTVYVGSEDGYFYAINPDGTLKWKLETGDWVGSSPAIAKDGTVYVGSDDGYLYAIDPDGTLKWKFETKDWVRSSPAIAKDGSVYIGSDDGYLYAINPDGTVKWKLETGDWVGSSPAIAKDGSVYVGSGDRYLYAINPNGTLKWKFETGGEVASSPAIAKDGSVYVGSKDSYLYALKPNGSLKWKLETGDWVGSSPAIAKDGTVYVGSGDSYLYALKPNGSLKWKFETGGLVWSSPAIGKNGTVYVGSNDYYLYAINADGTLKWKFETGDWVGSSLAIAKDGIIYVGSGDGYLYAVGERAVASHEQLPPTHTTRSTTGKENTYNVEYELSCDAYFERLKVKVSGPAEDLAVLLTNPKGETSVSSISRFEMIDNTETTAVRMGEMPLSEGPYTLTIKTISPEKVVYRKQGLTFTAPDVSLIDAEFSYAITYSGGAYGYAGRYCLRLISLSITNAGDLAAYIEEGWVIVEGNPDNMPLSRYEYEERIYISDVCHGEHTLTGSSIETIICGLEKGYYSVTISLQLKRGASTKLKKVINIK